MTWKSYVLVSGAGVLATYLVSPPLMPQRAAPAPPQEPAVATSNGPPVNIEQEAARLGARLRAEAAFRTPARNPFRFGDRPADPTSLGADVPAEEPPPAEPDPPFVVLSGIATDVVDGVPQRTAVLTTVSGVLLVRAGEMVGSDYRVRAIEAGSVELESTTDGTIRELRLPFPVP